MEEGNQFLLQVSVQIDQEIAATDQVEFGKCRVFVDVMFGKDQQVTNCLIDAIAGAVIFQGKKARQPFG